MSNKRNLKRLAVLTAGLLVVPASSSAALTWYTSAATWNAARASGGYTVFYGGENFEQSSLAGASVLGMNDPLSTGVANGPFATGLLHPGLWVQSNLDPTGLLFNNPRGVNGLATASAGFAGAVSDIVLANTFVDSYDTMFGPGVAAAGFDALDFLGTQTGITVKAFDAGNNLMGTTASPANAGGTNFLGVISTTPIARLNIFSTGGGAEGWDNLTTYNAVPEPASMVALGIGALALMRRRRKTA